MKVWHSIAAMGLGATVAAAVLINTSAADRGVPISGVSADSPDGMARELAETRTRLLAELEALRDETRALRNRQDALTVRYDALEDGIGNRIGEASLGALADPDPTRAHGDSLYAHGASPYAGGDSPYTGGDAAYGEDALDDPIAQANRLAAMDGAMYARVADPAWDTLAAANVTSAFDAAATDGSELLSASCHGGLCRVELHHADEEAATAVLDAEEPLVPWSHKGRVETIPQPSGALTTIIYATRDGEDFPAGF